MIKATIHVVLISLSGFYALKLFNDRSTDAMVIIFGFLLQFFNNNSCTAVKASHRKFRHVIIMTDEETDVRDEQALAVCMHYIAAPKPKVIE
jgi:esterase/lipase superfamily enzyme